MTERAELLALADREAFIDAHHKHLDLTEINDAWGRPMFRHSHVEAMWDGWKKGRAALRHLASQDQEPVAWRDLTYNNLNLTRGVAESAPLYLSPRAVEAAAGSNASVDDYRNAIDEALVVRYLGVAKGNAKSELDQIISWEVDANLDPTVSSRAQALIDQGRNASAEATYNIGRWLSAALEDPNACEEFKRDIRAWMEAGKPNVQLSDASAEARWRSISEDTSWLDGRDVVLLANDMEVQARYCPWEWSDETPNTPREYSGAVWSCFDDQFHLEIEECSKDPSEWRHDGVTHWRPVYAHPHTSDCARETEDDEWATRLSGDETTKSEGGVQEPPASNPDYNGVKSPALVTAHGLSGQSCPLNQVVLEPSDRTADVKCEACSGTGRHMGRFSMNDPDCTYCNGKGKVRASDCDKQGETDCGATRCRDLGCFGACKPSDRPADVTVDELEKVINSTILGGGKRTARALLRAFTVGRR